MIGKILSFLFGVGSSTASKVIGTAGTIAALTGLITWLFGPGREINICLNPLELTGVALGFQTLMQWILRLPPPED